MYGQPQSPETTYLVNSLWLQSAFEKCNDFEMYDIEDLI